MVQMRNWRILLELDGASGNASYRDILAGLARAIKDGRLQPGAPLPGTREMAGMLGVNRKTVIVAYEEAVIKGWLVSEQRRGTFVSAAFDAGAAAATRTQSAGAQPGSRAFAPAFLPASLPSYFDHLAQPADGRPRGDGMMYFDNGSPDHRLLPQAVLHRHYRNAMRDSLRSGRVRYGNPEAARQLRTALAEMLGATRALAVSPSCICLTQGTQMALHLVASALIRPGDVVLVERLSYPPAWAIFRALGARIEVVDIDADGCRVSQVEEICRRRPVRCIYLTPHHQFPSTVSLRADRREKLLALAAQHAFSIIEEDYDHEYHFSGRPYPPLASDARQRNVIYVGSLSKLLGPSFRCGFIVAPENLIQALEQHQFLLSTHGDVVMQKMMADLIGNGELRRHVRRSSKHYRARQEVLLDCLHAGFGEHIATRAPQGGLALWVTFDPQTDVDAMARHALQEGLFVRSGSQFSPVSEPVNGLRLGFASMAPDELVRAVARLQRAWKSSLR
ncbi:PLP-dependent aminotransferase family protein [Herbaspirillum robiniae]|uniref:GntR family transcriptional regulator n=1 Tax=Herbaspirillum robiniae TaxID=2014887 RepID=A0A246WPZ7_9BURK|nr:PLP-dependent aminotransferase family protein [Herbaspirillum robiniae]OWY28446.1 GntR family transcriptional regulator [Herbaspirillum robiniae]